MEKLHTPEPWGFYQTETTGLPPDPCPCLVIDTLGREIPSTNPVVCIISDISSLNKRDHANACRIVACVNACRSVSDEDLADDCVEKMKADRDALLIQRDELLAALKDIRDMSLNPAHTMTYSGLEGTVDGCHKTALMYLEKYHA